MSKHLLASGERPRSWRNQTHRQSQLFNELFDPLFSSSELNRISRATNQRAAVLIIEG